jgi:hypothetical protein
MRPSSCSRYSPIVSLKGKTRERSKGAMPLSDVKIVGRAVDILV